MSKAKIFISLFLASIVILLASLFIQAGLLTPVTFKTVELTQRRAAWKVHHGALKTASLTMQDVIEEVQKSRANPQRTFVLYFTENTGTDRYSLVGCILSDDAPDVISNVTCGILPGGKAEETVLPLRNMVSIFINSRKYHQAEKHFSSSASGPLLEINDPVHGRQILQKYFSSSDFESLKDLSLKR